MRILTFALFISLMAACSNDVKQDASDKTSQQTNTNDTSISSTQKSSANKQPADAKTILARKEVPILCYHQIRDWKPSDSKGAREIIVPIQLFKDQIKMLKDSGYNTILPDQLYNYLVYGDSLPEKPVMITFDDTDEDQYSIGNEVLKQYGYKGVYFMMTVSINRPPNYMTKDQIKQLAAENNCIALHTWNHQKVPSYTTDEDWNTQITKPRKVLQDLTGQPVEYFAYPYGLWNKEAFEPLKKNGIKAAFILATKRDENDPLYTIRRIIASGYWSPKGLYQSMQKSFK